MDQLPKKKPVVLKAAQREKAARQASADENSRRRFVRYNIKPRLLVKVSYGGVFGLFGRSFHAYLANVCQGGFGLVSMDLPPKGSQVSIEVFSLSEVHRFKAQVVHVSESHKGTIVGVEFKSPQENIISILKSCQAETQICP